MPTPPQDAAEGPRLSLDVLYLICEESPKQTVASLCRVSRALLPFAQRRLFHTVDLVGASIVTTRSWCAAVLRHTDLAKSVHSLSLQPEDGIMMEAAATQISAAVNRCTNLKILRVYGPADVYKLSANWMLTSGDPHPFQLVEFTNSYFSFASLASFLATQNELRFLIAPEGLDHLSSNRVPKLATLVGAKTPATWTLPLPRDWPLQRIEMLLTGHGLFYLPLFSHSLTTLNLLNNNYTPDNFSGMLLPLSQKLPHLEHLALVDVNRSISKRPEASPAQLIRPFRRLRTFTLISRGATDFCDSGHCFRVSHESDMHAMAVAALNVCSTLYRVVIGTETQEEVGERMYIATKSSDGEVEMVVEEKIDFEAVSMFWV